jgi:hypothetical protein
MAETVKSFAALILFSCMSMTVLLAQLVPAPAQFDRSAAKSQEASAYANTKLTYKIENKGLNVGVSRVGRGFHDSLKLRILNS